MFKTLSNIIWLFLLVGVVFLITDPMRTNRAFYNFYTIALQFYLFGVCAYLVLKRVIFYRLRGDINVVSLSKKSEYQLNLVMQGIVLALVYLVYVRNYGNLKSVDTIIISVLLFYYIAQVFINSNPAIYMDDDSFSYDDYFIDKWNWSDLESIQLQNDSLRLVSEEKDFELDFTMVDEVDYHKLTTEVELNVLDGEFAKDKTSQSLIEIIENYAKYYGVKIG